MSEDSTARLFIDFGPYGVLAVMLGLAVMFTRTAIKRSQDSNVHGIRTAQAGMALSWIIVLATVTYVLMKWPPMQVRLITLGAHPVGANFVSIDERVYINSQAMVGNRNSWRLAVVRRMAEDHERKVRFSYTFPYTNPLAGTAEVDDPVVDFELTVEQLAYVKELQPDPANPGVLLYDHDGDIDSPMVPLSPVGITNSPVATAGLHNPGFLIRTAAAEDTEVNALQTREQMDTLKLQVQSHDPVQRAAARETLRSTNTKQLQELSQELGDSANPEIRKYLSARRSQEVLQSQQQYAPPPMLLDDRAWLARTAIPPAYQMVWMNSYAGVQHLADQKERKLLSTALMLGTHGVPYQWGGRTPMIGVDSMGYLAWTLAESGVITPSQQRNLSSPALEMAMRQPPLPGERAVVEIYPQGIVAFVMPDGTRYAYLPSGPMFFPPNAGASPMGMLGVSQLAELAAVLPQ